MPPTSYVLRFPFLLEQGREISGLDATVRITGGDIQLKLTESEGLYVASLSGFSSREDAEAFVPRVWVGLMWMQLNRRIAFDAELEKGTVTYADDPEEAARNLRKTLDVRTAGPVHGLADGLRPAVFEEGENILFSVVGTPSIRVGIGAEDFRALLTDGMSHAGADKILRDDNLRTALDLYAAHFSEHSVKARFLTLVMALECLSNPARKHASALTFLDRWSAELDDRLSALDSSSDEADALDSLKRELLFRRDDSIRRRVRRMVQDVMHAVEAPDAHELAKDAVQVYDDRSKLSHEGHLDPKRLRTGYRTAESILRRLLMAHFDLAARSTT